MRMISYLLLATALLANAQSPLPSEPESEVRVVLQEFSEARNAGDAKRVAATFAENGAYTPTGGVVIKGRAAIEAVWAKVFRFSPAGHATREIHRIRIVTPTVAVADDTVSTSGFPETGNPKLVDVYVLMKNGSQWQIAEAWTAFASR